MQVVAFVAWSLTVKAANKNKVQSVHIPALDKLLGKAEFGWQITSDSATGTFGITTYQNLQGEIEHIILEVLRRAYRLRDGWNIHGLSALNTKELKCVIGGWRAFNKSNLIPSIESAMFELKEGNITGISDDGGWMVRETGRSPP